MRGEVASGGESWRVKKYARNFYKSTAWEQTREAYLKSVGGLCERCLKKGLIVPAYIVHHKVYISPDNINDPDVTLNWNNLEALCQACHNGEHFGEEYTKRYKVDELGRVTVTE